MLPHNITLLLIAAIAVQAFFMKVELPMLVLGFLLERMTPHPDILTLEPFLVLAELFEKVQLLNLTQNCGVLCSVNSGAIKFRMFTATPPHLPVVDIRMLFL